MSPGRQVDVLIVEDSTVSRLALAHLIASDPQLRVIAALPDGQAAVDFVLAAPPDVVLMDVHMSGIDGFEATRRIMAQRPVPIVICSASTHASDVTVAFQALAAGALACVAKPVGRGDPRYGEICTHLLQTLRQMADVRVGRRAVPPLASGELAAMRPPELPLPCSGETLRLVAIGASTGGPPALQALLQGLPVDFEAPLLIVQHLSPGFVRGMADWLNQGTSLAVRLAADGAMPLPGHAYLAPDGTHMGVDGRGAIRLSSTAPENHVRPAVSHLFRSLLESFASRSAAVLLTGMGSDGAEEMKLLRDRGATTFAQDAASSVVHGMPGAAIALGAASHVLSPERIALALIALVARRRHLPRSATSDG